MLEAIEAKLIENNALESKSLETKKRQPTIGWRLLLVGAVLEQPSFMLSYYIY
ncbi:hypothetical protein [Vibrio gallaecicus]|uniref:hypothetical protein n=1 Tax=Vibrio gallaecicus TaxID=552386 RepID=UPI0025B2C665|nr:hypothetical protein [Vibrio gallaecicus]MDN3616336.1 hypothetical protein [Vibrio gallaecicus]